MKCMIIAIFALVAAINAKPFDVFSGNGSGVGVGLNAGVGYQGREGLGFGGFEEIGRGIGSQYQQANQMGSNAFNNNARGFGAQGLHAGGGVSAYDRGEQESSFSSITQGHQKSSFDKGINQSYGIDSSSVGGYDQSALGLGNFASSVGSGSTFTG